MSPIPLRIVDLHLDERLANSVEIGSSQVVVSVFTGLMLMKI